MGWDSLEEEVAVEEEDSDSSEKRKSQKEISFYNLCNLIEINVIKHNLLC